MAIQFRILALDTRVCSGLNVFLSEGGRENKTMREAKAAVIASQQDA